MVELKFNEDGTIEKIKKADLEKDIKNSKFFTLTKEQRDILIEDIKNSKLCKYNQKHLVIAYLSMYGGLRRGEIAQCRREWTSKIKVAIDGVEREYLAVDIPYRDKNIKSGKGKFIWKAKTKKSQRTAIIFDERISTFLEIFYQNNPTGVQCSQDYIYKVVCNKDVKYSFLNRILRSEDIEENEKKRLQGITPHSLRSTYAYICRELGISLEDIA